MTRMRTKILRKKRKILKSTDVVCSNSKQSRHGARDHEDEREHEGKV